MSTTLEAFPVITGIAGYLPGEPIPNAEHIRLTGIASESVTPDLIVKRTGIEQRHRIADDEQVSDMAAHAGRRALLSAGMTREEVEELRVASLTDDNRLPSVASQVHGKLGLSEGISSDTLNNACAGSAASLRDASAMIMSGMIRSSLVIGADAMSRVVGNGDRGPNMVFADGAGAMVVRRGLEMVKPKFISFTASDTEAICIPAGGTKQPIEAPDDPAGKLNMNGRLVGEYAAQLLPKYISEFAEKAECIDGTKVNWRKLTDKVVFHQANQRLIENAAEKLKIPEDMLVLTVNKHGNTSGASIPLALAEAHRRGEIQGRTRVLLAAIGAGFVGTIGRITMNIAKPDINPFEG